MCWPELFSGNIRPVVGTPQRATNIMYHYKIKYLKNKNKFQNLQNTYHVFLSGIWNQKTFELLSCTLNNASGSFYHFVDQDSNMVLRTCLQRAIMELKWQVMDFGYYTYYKIYIIVILQNITLQIINQKNQIFNNYLLVSPSVKWMANVRCRLDIWSLDAVTDVLQ